MRRRRDISITLGKAAEIGLLVRVKCDLCGVVRFFLPAELMQVLGDIGHWSVEEKMRCARCGTREYLMASVEALSAAERQGATVRRLVSVRTVRRAVWRDEHD